MSIHHWIDELRAAAKVRARSERFCATAQSLHAAVSVSERACWLSLSLSLCLSLSLSYLSVSTSLDIIGLKSQSQISHHHPPSVCYDLSGGPAPAGHSHAAEGRRTARVAACPAGVRVRRAARRTAQRYCWHCALLRAWCMCVCACVHACMRACACACSRCDIALSAWELTIVWRRS